MGLALAAAALVVVGAIVAASLQQNRHGAKVVRWSLDSALLKRSLEEVGVRPAGGGRRPLLVLLHGRGDTPDELLDDQLFDGLAKLGPRAPDVAILSGGDHSFYHDRGDGPWGSYVLREAIPQAVERLGADPRRVAIGGPSMGGYGALLAAARAPGRFCAVGAHSPAVWSSAGAADDDAFDDPEDFARNDVYRMALYEPAAWRGERVWIDVGRDDPFRAADVAVGRSLAHGGVDVSLHVWPGGHGGGYFADHLESYLAWYGRVLADCRR